MYRKVKEGFDVFAEEPVKPVFACFDIWVRKRFDNKKAQQCHEERGNHKIGELKHRNQKIKEGIWCKTFLLASLYIEIVNEWLDGLADHQYADDANDGYKGYGPQYRMLVAAPRNIDILCDVRVSFPDLNLLLRPSVINMAKSSPKPKMKVEMIMLMILNSM